MGTIGHGARSGTPCAIQVNAMLPAAASSARVGKQFVVQALRMRQIQRVRPAFVHAQRRVTHALRRDRAGQAQRGGLVVVAVNHERRNVELVEVGPEVGLGKGRDAIERAFSPPCSAMNDVQSSAAREIVESGRFEPVNNGQKLSKNAARSARMPARMPSNMAISAPSG